MNIHEMNNGLTKFLAECAALAEQKNRDYHPDGVAMLEVLQTAWETGISPEQDLWARMRKQLSALRRFVIEGHVESEPPKSRFMDTANYCAILNFWTENRKQILVGAWHFVKYHRRCEAFGGVIMGRTCISEGRHSDEWCDRCSFVIWLGQQAGDARS